MKKGRTVLTIVGVVLVLAAIGFSLRPRPVPVELGRIEKGLFHVTVDEEGRTRVKERYVIPAPISGDLLRIRLEPGDVVEEGALLATIVPIAPGLLDARTRAGMQARVGTASAAVRQAEATAAQAEAAARFATRELETVRALYQGGALPKQQLDHAELEQTSRARMREAAAYAVRMARSELAGARAALRQSSTDDRLEHWEVRAPVKGRVLRVIQEHQGPVVAGTPLLELADPASLEVVVDVLTADAVDIRPGAAVKLDRWGGAETLEGRVRLVEPSGFTRLSALGVEEQRVNVVVDLVDPRERWGALGDGYRVEARIEVYRADSAVRVPVTALFRQDEGWAVFLNDGGKARRQPVTIGRRNGLDAEVVNGLEAGREVVLHPGDKVAEGVAVAAM